MQHVLVVAGSDSSGGAGIVRDVETLVAFGVKASVAITAITVQTHAGVRHVDTVTPSVVADQMRASFASNRVAAIKIGMLATAGTISAVARALADHPDIPVVLDPVLVSTSGHSLLTQDAVEQLHRLFRLCSVVTPNLPELAHLSIADRAVTFQDVMDQAQSLMRAGAPAVLVKGGHGEGEDAVDILFRGNAAAPYRLTAPRLSASMRGTGCMLASAMAACLAAGDDLAVAATKAKTFVRQKLMAEDG